jgi:hypothetical protein
VTSQLPLLLVVGYSFWLPQLLHNVSQAAKQPLQPAYIINCSFARLLLPVYTLTSSSNLLKVPPQPELAALLMAWVGLQVGLLLLQHYTSPHVLLPESWIPMRYNYHRPELPWQFKQQAAAAAAAAAAFAAGCCSCRRASKGSCCTEQLAVNCCAAFRRPPGCCCCCCCSNSGCQCEQQQQQQQQQHSGFSCCGAAGSSSSSGKSGTFCCSSDWRPEQPPSERGGETAAAVSAGVGWAGSSACCTISSSSHNQQQQQVLTRCAQQVMDLSFGEGADSVAVMLNNQLEQQQQQQQQQHCRRNLLLSSHCCSNPSCHQHKQQQQQQLFPEFLINQWGGSSSSSSSVQRYQQSLPEQCDLGDLLHDVEEDYDFMTGQGTVECVICMAGVQLLPISERMVTPCGHFFHPDCLASWMEVKAECPTCRGPLPPL